MFLKYFEQRTIELMKFPLLGVLSIGLRLTVLSASIPVMAQIVPIDDYSPPAAFAGQTRAPLASQGPKLIRTTLASDLIKPWGLEFMPDGRMLIGDIIGRIRILDQNGNMSAPLNGVPAVTAYYASGLHDIVLDPDFTSNRYLYFAYVASPEGDPGTKSLADLHKQSDLYLERRKMLQKNPGMKVSPFGYPKVARAKLSRDDKRLEDVEVLIDAPAKRLVFAPDGTLYITTMGIKTGGAYDIAQDMNSTYGKILRINTDGSIPDDNPFVGKTGVNPAIFAYGFRDPAGADLHPVTGELWVTVHGPRGGDEIEIIHSGKNYGWPIVTYGRNYDKSPIGEGLTVMDGVEQPIYFWSPSIAPGGMTFYTGDMFPEWKGDLFVGALVLEHLARLKLDGNRVISEDRLFSGFGDRIREVRQGPEGALYIFTDTASDDGQLIRLTRKPPPGEH
jgi:glucose/arabinose dehydrogenase